MTVRSWNLTNDGPSAINSWLREKERERTLVGHRRCGNDHVGVILVLKPLAEDIHVQRPQEAETTALAERRRRFTGYRDAAICQSQLNPQSAFVT